ncbi:MAG: S49 family peptidase [Rubripirellula sp.]
MPIESNIRIKVIVPQLPSARTPITMLRLLPVLLTLVCLTGCHRPMRVITSGGLDFDGNMDMTGDMNMSGDVRTSVKSDNSASRLSRVTVSGHESTANSIAVIGVDDLLINQNISGLGSMGENPVALFREKLRVLSKDPSVSAIVLRIDTPGGGANAADQMAHELEQFRSQCKVPVVACIMSVGAGGGYYLACHADHIISQPTSIVGGIGVILNTYNLEDTLAQFNVISVPVKSGEKIDIASPQRTMEDGERDILQGIANQMHERFIAHVKRSRPRVAADSPVFDGRVVSGQEAVELALVDQLGYMDDAIAVASQMANVPPHSSVVMLRRDNDRAYTVLDKTPNRPSTGSLIPLNVPGLDRSNLPTFLYLWQADPKFVTASGG